MAAYERGLILHECYQILDLLGAGGMGEVYKAFDRANSRLVALKRMLVDMLPVDRPEAERKFEVEARLLKSLDHPGVPRVFDYFLHEGNPCMVMEFVEGTSLDRWMEDQIQFGFPPDQRLVADWGLQLCGILDYIHTRERPLLHRDVKPGNIILRAHRVTLVDFGLARDFSLSPSTKTQVGTLGFCSIEQAQGHPTPRSDLYSLGVTLNYLLSGIPPAPFLVQPLDGGGERNLHPALVEAVNRACSLEADQRPASARELGETLRNVLGELSGWEPAGPARAVEDTVPVQPPVEAGRPTVLVAPEESTSGASLDPPDETAPEGGERDSEDSSGVKRWIAAARTRMVRSRATLRRPMPALPTPEQPEDDMEFLRGLQAKAPPLWANPFVLVMLVLLITMGVIQGAEQWSAQRLEEAACACFANGRAGAGRFQGGVGLERDQTGSTLATTGPSRRAGMFFDAPTAPGTVSFQFRPAGEASLLAYLGDTTGLARVDPEGIGLRQAQGVALWLEYVSSRSQYDASLVKMVRFEPPPGGNPVNFLRFDRPLARARPVAPRDTYSVVATQASGGWKVSVNGQSILSLAIGPTGRAFGLVLPSPGRAPQEVHVWELRVR